MAEIGSPAALLPLALFMAVMLGISFFVRWQARAGEGGFLRQYFVGNRDLGGFVLAMTTVATYSSVSSFVGGPGMAWSVGFGWIYMAVVQVTAVFLVLGIFGKRVALLARKFGAVTVVDILRRRFRSDALAAMAAFIIVLFFCATMTAQFVGGAKLFAAVTGYSYEAGLLLFGVAVIVYTAIGGFRAVAITDACCAIMMMIGIVLLFYHVLETGGSAEEALEILRRGVHASELAFIAVALDVQHLAGGSMKQVLDAARDSMKGELALRRSLRVQTAQAKLSARIVVVMPFILVSVFSLASPDFLTPFFSSVFGYALFALAVFMQVAGVVLVHRALSVDGVA